MASTPTSARIIAIRGGDNLLIDVGNGQGTVWNTTTGDVGQRTISVLSILARGYWEDYDGPQDLPLGLPVPTARRY